MRSTKHSKSALRKATLTVFGVVCVSAISAAGLLKGLAEPQWPHPVVESIIFTPGTGEGVCVHDEGPVMIWNENTLDCGGLASVSSITSVLSDWILQQDTVGVSNDPLRLTYIDFFAGAQLSNHRFAAYRLLQSTGWMTPHSEMMTREVEYLYPDIPLTIQGREGTVSLDSVSAVKEWKTEVLQQEYFVSRLQQYTVFRISEEHSKVKHHLSSVPKLELRLKHPSDWTGWATVNASVQVSGCPVLTITEGFFVSSSSVKPPTVYIPIWQWKDDPGCMSRLETDGIKAFTNIQVHTTHETRWDTYRTQRYTKKSTDCPLSVETLTAECFQHK